MCVIRFAAEILSSPYLFSHVDFTFLQFNKNAKAENSVTNVYIQYSSLSAHVVHYFFILRPVEEEDQGKKRPPP